MRLTEGGTQIYNSLCEQISETMACSEEFIDFVYSQIKDTGTVRAKKMFGDWMIYVDEKPIVIACDNICFVKMLPAVRDISLTLSIVKRLSKSFGHFCPLFLILRKGRRNRSGEHCLSLH